MIPNEKTQLLMLSFEPSKCSGAIYRTFLQEYEVLLRSNRLWMRVSDLLPDRKGDIFPSIRLVEHSIIEQFHVIQFVNQYIFWFQILCHQSAFMKVSQTDGSLIEYPKDNRKFHRQAFGQRFANVFGYNNCSLCSSN